MTNPNDNAFPRAHPSRYINPDDPDVVFWERQANGMSKREYFAGTSNPSWNAVMELLQNAGIQKPNLEQKLEARAALRVMEANALIAELNKEAK